MEWDDLRYLLALTRAGSLSDAAEHLNVTRTTVGRRLRAMEASLGVRLFDRTPDGFAPTPAGQELAEVAERLETEVQTAESRLLGRDAELRGRLRVSTLDFIYESFSGVFSSFMARYPHVELTIEATTKRVSLLRREADVALRLHNSPPESLVGRRVGTMQFALYGSRCLVERIGVSAPLGDYPWLHQDERSDGRWLENWLAGRGIKPKIAMRSDCYAVLRKAISTGLGVYFLPCVEGDAAPELVSLGPRLSEQARSLWLLTLPDLCTNSRVRAFMDHAYEAFGRHQQALEGVSAPAHNE